MGVNSRAGRAGRCEAEQPRRAALCPVVRGHEADGQPPTDLHPPGAVLPGVPHGGASVHYIRWRRCRVTDRRVAASRACQRHARPARLHPCRRRRGCPVPASADHASRPDGVQGRVHVSPLFASRTVHWLMGLAAGVAQPVGLVNVNAVAGACRHRGIVVPAGLAGVWRAHPLQFRHRWRAPEHVGCEHGDPGAVRDPQGLLQWAHPASLAVCTWPSALGRSRHR